MDATLSRNERFWKEWKEAGFSRRLFICLKFLGLILFWGLINYLWWFSVPY